MNSELLDETPPGFSAAIAQHNTEAIGYARDGAAVSIAKGIAYGFFADLFGGSTPDIAELVAETEVIAMPKTVETRAGTFFFKIEESARYFGMDLTALEDTPMNHQFPLSGHRHRMQIRESP